MFRLCFYAKKQLNRIRRDENGASMIEYSILVGLLAVGAVVAIVSGISGWLGNQWANLQIALGIGP